MVNPRELIAKRVARFFNAGDLVNLGIGMPTAVANYIPADSGILLHSENGFIGLGPTPLADMVEKDVVNAGGAPVTMVPGQPVLIVLNPLLLYGADIWQLPY